MTIALYAKKSSLSIRAGEKIYKIEKSKINQQSGAITEKNYNQLVIYGERAKEKYLKKNKKK